MKKIAIYLFTVFATALLFTKAHAQTVYFGTATNSYSIIEGGTFTFTVNLYSASTTPITVYVTTNPGTADASDFTPLTTTVTIPAGLLSSTGSLTVQTANDSTIEQNEYLTIDGTVTSGVTTNTSFSRTLFVTDNDAPPMVTIYGSLPSITVNEFNLFPVYIQLSNPYNSAIVVNLVSTNGTATASDYQAISTTITIPPGQTSGVQNINIINDAFTEPDETFTITATITSGNTANSSVTKTVIIMDDDTLPTVSISNYNASEGGNAQFYVGLNRPYNTAVVVQLSTTNGTASSADYTPFNQTITINPGATYSNSTIVSITDDTLDEPEEIFVITANVTSGNTTNPSLSTNQTIVDNDGLPDLKVSASDAAGSSATIEEGKPAGFYVYLTHANSVDTAIQITTTNGTAGNTDYTALTTTVTIPTGQTYYTGTALQVPTLLDQLQEGDETFTITATSVNTYNTSDSLLATIIDNYNANAQNDNLMPIAEVGGTFNVFANDTYHGLPLNASDVTVTLGANSIGATLNSVGILTIPSSVPLGYYQLSYTICETANPSNCDTATIEIQVQSPLSATYTITYSDYNSDGYISAGDVLNYQFSITNNGNATITNIDYAFVYGINAIGGPIASLGAGQTDSATFTATHILTQSDINFGYSANLNQLEIGFKGTYYGYEVFGFAQQVGSFSLPIPDGIKLKAFVDSNSNGTQESTEIDFPLGQFNYEINNDGTIHNLYTTPFYLYETNPTTSYDLTYTVDSDYASNNTCSVSYPNVTVATGSGITTYNFPITVTPYDDLSVSMTNFGAPPRPGFWYYNYITYTNNSNQTVPTGTITFTKDTALSIIDATSGASITATGFTYNFSNLLPYETRYVWVKLQVPNIPTVALGQLVTNSATITTLPGDILPLNNNSSLTQTIVGAFDPNDKQENHGGKILHSTFTSDDYLTYTIRFENTGTANAINIKVEDELDAELDETTLKMVAASADYSLERVNRNLVWKFNGIDLPPSEPDTEIGHGYITFKIKPKTGYAIGDIIPNTAEIYFDFNPPIVTNTCNTEFVATLSTNPLVFTNLNYFPNPVSNTLTIVNEFSMDSIEITSALGQKILTQKVNDVQTEINLNHFANGIYFVKVISEGQEKTIKIAKE